jgi:hypothetical protein
VLLLRVGQSSRGGPAQAGRGVPEPLPPLPEVRSRCGDPVIFCLRASQSQAGGRPRLRLGPTILDGSLFSASSARIPEKIMQNYTRIPNKYMLAPGSRHPGRFNFEFSSLRAISAWDGHWRGSGSAPLQLLVFRHSQTRGHGGKSEYLSASPVNSGAPVSTRVR